MVHGERGRATIQRLPAEYAAKGTVVLLSDSRDDAVHGPPVQLVIGEDLERHVVLFLITLDCL